RPAREDVAPELGGPLVDPEQGAVHRLLVVGGEQTGGAPVFSVPTVHVLVTQQARDAHSRVFLEQCAFFAAIVARFVVLQSEMRDVTGERKEPGVMPIHPRAEQRTGLRDEPTVTRGITSRDLERRVA